METLKICNNADIIITKSAGLSGAYTLAKDKYEELRKRYSSTFLEPVLHYDSQLQYEVEYEVLKDCEYEAVIEAGYGGIYGALFNLGYQSGLGFRVDLQRIPIEQPTIEVAEFFELNPYLLHSKGAMVIATKNGEILREILEQRGICASFVGHMTKQKGRIVYLDEEERFLTPARKDELLKYYSKKDVLNL